jgi:tetratricopeptide (TPR) repeat protein
VTEGKTQRLNDAKTQSKDSATLCLCDSASYYESQIRKADSLYKNYLPQYNFEEVKAAMEFFDSYQQSAISGQRWRLFGKETDDGNRLIAESRQLTTAKAHYYHAVGLTEKDDVVGACEHYLIALEIMEDDDIIKSLRDTKTQRRKVLKKQRNDEKALCDSVTLRLCDSDEDYERIRFIHLIHTRLGELFLEEGCSNLSIINNISALRYSYMLNNDVIQARTLKCIGNGYLLSNNIDSALFYYNESLKICSDNDNKLDIEKCFAQILYNEGEKNTAFALLKKNLNEINNENVKYSYHCLLGNLYYNNKVYDSALYYLEESLDNNIITKKIAFTTTLSAIYDSISNYEKKAYYDNFSANLLKNSINKEVDRTKLQILYNNYNQRKADKEITTAKMKAKKKQ